MAEQTPDIGNLRPGCDSEQPECTPPDSQISPPLTPPPTADRPPASNDPVETRVLSFFTALADPHIAGPTQALATFCLSPESHLRLEKALEGNPSLRKFVDDKVRFDYEPTAERLTIRMPSAVHEFAVAFLATRIGERLSQIVEGGDKAAEFAAKIAHGGSARIILAENISEGETDLPVRREPDAQFQHREAAYPGVVLEVSYSQDGKNLRRLATDYILRSNGDIKAVIGLDINYHGKESTVSLWRPNYVQDDGEEFETLEVIQEIMSQRFRSSDGLSVNPGTCLSLKLRDFATDAIPLNHEPVALSISYRQLFDDLTRAEEMQSVRDADNGAKSTRKTRKRKQSSSPHDRLRSDDEAEYRTREIEAEERVAAGDLDFLAPAAKRRA